MQVVDREKGRLVKGRVGREPVEAVEDREGALCGRVPRTAGLRGSEERLYQRGRPREQLPAEIRRDGREQRLEQLPDDPVRKLALELAAAGREHSHPRRAGNRARLGEQAGLADAGTSLDDDESSTALPGRVGQCLQGRDLGFALQEQAGGLARGNDTRQRHHGPIRRTLRTNSLGARLGLAPTRGALVRVQPRGGRVVRFGGHRPLGDDVRRYGGMWMPPPTGSRRGQLQRSAVVSVINSRHSSPALTS